MFREKSSPRFRDALAALIFAANKFSRCAKKEIQVDKETNREREKKRRETESKKKTE